MSKKDAWCSVAQRCCGFWQKRLNCVLLFKFLAFVLVCVTASETSVAAHWEIFWRKKEHPFFALYFSFHDNGQIKQVIYNNPARAVKLTIPVEKVQDLYRALKKYNDLLYSEECHITLKMRPGTETTQKGCVTTELKHKSSSRMFLLDSNLRLRQKDEPMQSLVAVSVPISETLFRGVHLKVLEARILHLLSFLVSVSFHFTNSKKKTLFCAKITELDTLSFCRSVDAYC